MALQVLRRHCVSLYLVECNKKRCARSGGVLRAAAVARHVAALAHRCASRVHSRPMHEQRVDVVERQVTQQLHRQHARCEINTEYGFKKFKNATHLVELLQRVVVAEGECRTHLAQHENVMARNARGVDGGADAVVIVVPGRELFV